MLRGERRRAHAGGTVLAAANGEDELRARAARESKLPYVSVMTDPTTGGVSASLALLGDINIAEPGALICFAGPRVIEQTTGETLPEGFQRAEFLLEKGAIDMILDRRQARDQIGALLAKLSSTVPRCPERGGRPLVASSRRDFTLEDWLAWFEKLHPKKIDLTLDRVIAVLERARAPPPPYKVVTVAGTNGKGSCVAMLESIYWHAGYEVGAFTSPHLWRFNERIRLNGEDAADAELVELFETIDGALGAITLSYFEASTVAALLHFARRKVDVAVLEVGMGGRLDASNTVDADCALIVSIDLDHREWLGDDREAIGREKAGIVRARQPVVIADRDPPRSVLEHAAALEGAVPADRPRFRLPPRRRELAARGRRVCGAAAVAAVRRRRAVRQRGRLRHRGRALAERFAGRREPRSRRGSATRDCAAGSSGIASTASSGCSTSRTIRRPPRSCSRRSAVSPPARRTFAVFAAMRDKDLAGVLGRSAGRSMAWFVTQANAGSWRGRPRATRSARRLGGEEITVAARRASVAPRRAPRRARRSRARVRFLSHGGRRELRRLGYTALPRAWVTNPPNGPGPEGTTHRRGGACRARRVADPLGSRRQNEQSEPDATALRLPAPEEPLPVRTEISRRRARRCGAGAGAESTREPTFREAVAESAAAGGQQCCRRATSPRSRGRRRRAGARAARRGGAGRSATGRCNAACAGRPRPQRRRRVPPRLRREAGDWVVQLGSFGEEENARGSRNA